MLTIPFAPESPRWLVQHGHIERARDCLRKVRAESEIEAELLSIREAIAFEVCIIYFNARIYSYRNAETRNVWC